MSRSTSHVMYHPGRYEPPVRRRGRKEGDWNCPENGNVPDCELRLNDRNVGLLAGAVIPGWLNCSGAGLLACARSTQPARKLIRDATVIQSRILFLMIFIFDTSLSLPFVWRNSQKPTWFIKQHCPWLVKCGCVTLGKVDISTLVNDDHPPLLQHQ